MIYHLLRLYIYVAIFLLMLSHNSLAQSKSSSAKFGLGLEIGNWRPNDLSDDVTLTPLKKTKKNPYIGIILLKPWRWGMTFRGSLGYWNYCNDEPSPENMTIEIVSILLDLKYSILSDVMLMPYVSYGIGWVFGNETSLKASYFDKTGEWELGIGINVGTGFDFKITRKFNLAIEFRYHYVKFNRVVAFTNNYSGPKISLGVLYFF
jgi:opacity protein-like surface antigen